MDDARRCTAHRSDGSGRRCRKAAVRGTTVCATHGAAAPQVRRAARRRLLELAEPAIGGLAAALGNAAREKDWPQVISAARTILDRCGYGPGSSVKLDADVTADVTHTTGPAPLDVLNPRERFLATHLMAIAAARMGNPMAKMQVKGQREQFIQALDATLHSEIATALPVASDAAPAPGTSAAPLPLAAAPAHDDEVIEGEVVEETANR